MTSNTPSAPSKEEALVSLVATPAHASKRSSKSSTRSSSPQARARRMRYASNPTWLSSRLDVGLDLTHAQVLAAVKRLPSFKVSEAQGELRRLILPDYRRTLKTTRIIGGEELSLARTESGRAGSCSAFLG